MSTWSKVKRQVRRNMRETPKVRRRREAARRAQMAWSRRASLCSVHMMAASQFMAADGKLLADLYTRTQLGGETVFVTFDSPGGTFADYEVVMRETRDYVAKAILGKSFSAESVSLVVSLDTGRNFGPAVPL